MTATLLNTKVSEIEKKISDPSSLVTATVLNTKISEVENKILDHTTQEFNKLTSENFKERLKQANLVNKTDFDNKLISFNRKTTSNKTKYLEVQKKLYSLTTKDDHFFLGRTYFISDGSQNTFVHQPTLDTLGLKNGKGTDYILVYNSKLKPLYTASLHSIKLSGYIIETKFDRDVLVVERNNYSSKIVNVYIVYDLDAWSRNPTNNFKIKNLRIWSK